MSFRCFSVTERALVSRINRMLAPKGKRLRRARLIADSGRRHINSSLGRYYIFDDGRNWIVRTHVGIEALGRELGVLDNFEELTTD